MERMIDTAEIVVFGVGLLCVLLVNGCTFSAGPAKYLKVSGTLCVESEVAKVVCPEDTAKEETK